MKAERDPKTGKWLIQYRFTDWQGKRIKSTKRGFTTKREAEEWLRNFMLVKSTDINMSFEDFLALYIDDMENRLREHTMRTKINVFNTHILPYFKKKRMDEIKATDIRAWQNKLIRKDYSPTYLRNVHSQLSSVFNYAVKYYDLRSNPCTKAGSMGKKNADEMNFWTKEEFNVFCDSIMDKHAAYAGFMILYWTGIRIGELLALTSEDIDFEKQTLSVSKSYQRLSDRDVITAPKTPKSIRTIAIPPFLVQDLKEYTSSLYGLEGKDRLFPYTKYFFTHEMQRGIGASGVKRIRLHDLRHSHASLLVEMGFSPLEIAERLGHEKIETTLNTYSHLYPNKQAALANRLENVYKEDL